MNLTTKISEFIDQRKLIGAGERVLTGLSGGPDSTFLLLILQELYKDAAAVYINHNLRGEESRREEHFVREFCTQRKIPLFVETLQWKKIPGNLEEVARRKRYRHYSKVAAEHSFARVALAHHADDVAETFLLRLIRGSGPTGLSGIPAKRGIFIRPLLQCSRAEMLEYLTEKNISYFKDSTNEQLNFSRNRVRQELIPYIQKNFNAAFPRTLLRTAEWLKEQTALLNELLQAYRNLIHVSGGSTIYLNRVEYESLSAPLRKAILKMAIERADPDFRFSSRGMAALLHAIASNSTLELPGFLKMEATVESIAFSRKKIPGLVEVDVPAEGEYYFAAANTFLKFSSSAEPQTPSLNIAILDFEKASFPLSIRNPRKGDRFRPLGMNGRKKLSDLFIDRKIPCAQRKSIPLVLKNDDIIWIAGHQIHHDYRVTPETKKFLRIEMKHV